jgi:AraC-like DNA-binding protein
MTCQFPVDSLNMYRQRVLQDTTTDKLVFDHQLSLMSAAGSNLFRSTTRAWVARGQQDNSSNDIALLEMEDDLLASFLLLAGDSSVNRNRIALPADRALKDIEDYVCANLDTAITRDDLADKACVSIRSLSRAFEKKYGLGPMAFVRQRRLDACYRYLRSSERDETTVTQVAVSFGFEHLGKFAIAYKNTFGESPSATLLK